MAPTTHTYLDQYQSEPTSEEPLAIGGYLSLEKTYSFEPLAEKIAPEKTHHVLGLQGQLWGEYMPTASHVEYMAFHGSARLRKSAGHLVAGEILMRSPNASRPT